jgi:hypothetical protein
MNDVGTFITSLLSPLGIGGSLLCIFLLFYIDSIVFPTVPELFTVLIFTGETSLDPVLFGAAVLVTLMAAEVAGVLTLYYAVSRARLPDRISRVIRRYQGFLICPDERMILINRIAPMLPFVGAFIAVAKWDLRKSLTYVLLGGAIKYGIILSLSTLFLVFLSRGTATLFTIVMVLIIIVLSLVASYVRKQRMEDVDRIA